MKGNPVWEPRPKIKGTNRLVRTLSRMHLPYNVLPTNSFLRSFILSFPSFPSFFLLPPYCLSPFPMISQPSKPSKKSSFPYLPTLSDLCLSEPQGTLPSYLVGCLSDWLERRNIGTSEQFMPLPSQSTSSPLERATKPLSGLKNT